MRLLIAHLSDLHLREEANPILSRIDKLVQAIQSVEAQPDFCVIATSGDIAFSGTEAQYRVAVELLSAARERLERRYAGVPVRSAMVPGNHDCDYSRSGKPR